MVVNIITFPTITNAHAPPQIQKQTVIKNLYEVNLIPTSPHDYVYTFSFILLTAPTLAKTMGRANADKTIPVVKK